MGIEGLYQALPEGCELLARAIRDPAFAEPFSVANWIPGNPQWLKWGGAWAECARELSKLCETHSGLERRRFDVGPRWDVLHYLLSEARREGHFDRDDWGTHALRGAAALASHLAGGQGIPLRYSRPEIVQVIAEHLGPMTEEDLRRTWEPARMEAQAVYKFWADRAGEDEWGWTVEAFRGLQAFYRQVASHREGVLVTRD
ncbi:DUF1877 family protein [Hyalangium rubrum]|uniref:DUF1877 family protein n=1 Tax=Hyalangium rubrum TaxID=3103134 RepID=A0ABU5HI69_9BACT|nr:DUF1877 family protein [Hyalangium sp. s54d21]MDY7232574.1 DUF1877 family protein [Hyalangium sp. s54d21]